LVACVTKIELVFLARFLGDGGIDGQPNRDRGDGPLRSYRPAGAIGALVEFCRAFNTRGLALMERSWDSPDEASMDNPVGGIRRGWAEIRQV